MKRKVPTGLLAMFWRNVRCSLKSLKDRTWCHTGRTLKKGKDGTIYQSEDPYTQEKTAIERAYLLAERLGLPR